MIEAANEENNTEAKTIQVLSGLRAHYSVTDLENRKVCVITNMVCFMYLLLLHGDFLNFKVIQLIVDIKYQRNIIKCEYVHILVCIHSYILYSTLIYTHAHIHIYTYSLHVYTYMQRNAYIHAYTHIIYTYSHSFMYKYILFKKSIYSCINTLIHLSIYSLIPSSIPSAWSFQSSIHLSHTTETC